jgi:hypothetical protein
MVIGIDPGPTHSAYAVVCPDYSIKAAAKVENWLLEKYIINEDPETVVIESIQSYGKPVGRETFETCYAIGAFRYVADCRINSVVQLIPRQEYANALCGCPGNDAKLRQTLLLRFGSDTKGGPLYALKGNTDLRSAYAVAVYWLDTQRWAEGKL